MSTATSNLDFATSVRAKLFVSNGSPESEDDVRKKFRDFFESYPGPLVGSILIAFSIFLSELMAFKLIEESHTLNGLVEAAMIAGLLAVFVDPLVKAKAHKDATRDIFHHILGL